MALISPKLSNAALELVNDRKRRASDAENLYNLLSKRMVKELGVSQIMEAIRLSEKGGDRRYLHVCDDTDIGSSYHLGLTSAGFVSIKHGRPHKLKSGKICRGQIYKEQGSIPPRTQSDVGEQAAELR